MESWRVGGRSSGLLLLIREGDKKRQRQGSLEVIGPGSSSPGASGALGLGHTGLWMKLEEKGAVGFSSGQSGGP